VVGACEGGQYPAGGIGEARGNVVDILFDPNAMPDILSELAVSDEANRRAIIAERPGATVSVTEALHTCRDILDGRYDAVPVDAFYFKGSISEIETSPERLVPFGPVTLQSPPAEKSL
jgi:F0F1-type ATP synthase beta subunit